MKKKILVVFVASLVTIFALVACKSNSNNGNDSRNMTVIEPYSLGLRTNINLYFADNDKSKLIIERRIIKSDRNNIKTVIINELFKGPQSVNFENIIPNDVSIISTSELGGVLYLNLSAGIKNIDVDEKTEALILYSLVNTISDYSNESSIQILVEGERCNRFIKYYDVREPIKSSDIMMKDYKSPMDLINLYFCELRDGKFETALSMVKENREDAEKIKKHFLYNSEVNDSYLNFEINDYSIVQNDKQIFVTVYVQRHNSITNKEIESLIRFVINVKDNGEYEIQSVDG